MRPASHDSWLAPAAADLSGSTLRIGVHHAGRFTVQHLAGDRWVDACPLANLADSLYAERVDELGSRTVIERLVAADRRARAIAPTPRM